MSLLWLSDSSPLFVYSPSSSFFQSTDNTASWKGAADSSQRQLNDTQHVTQGPGAVVLPEVYATSFTPIFTSTPGVTPLLKLGNGDSTAWVSGQNFSQINEYSPQTFTLSAGCTGGGCESGELGFRGAWIGTQLSQSGSPPASAQLDDASSLISYSGFNPVGTASSGTVSAGSMDYSSTLSMTTTSGAAAAVTFTGRSIVVTGVAGPSSGSFTAALDGDVVATLNAYSDVEAHGVVLFFTSNLDPARSHTLVLTTTTGDGASTGLIIDSFIVYGTTGGTNFSQSHGIPTPATSTGGGAVGSGGLSSASSPAAINGATPSGSPNAGVIVGAVLGTLAGLFLLLWLFRKRMALRKPAQKPLNPWDEANMLQNMENEEIHVTTVAKQRYVYPGLVAHSELKKY